jgi:hypothetical protein
LISIFVFVMFRITLRCCNPIGSKSLSRTFCDAHGWGHGFIHGERQGTCGEVKNSMSIEEEVEQANLKGKTNWEIRQAGDKGFGIFVLRDYPADEVVFRATGLRETSERTSHSVQTAWHRHVSTTCCVHDITSPSTTTQLIQTGHILYSSILWLCCAMT